MICILRRVGRKTCAPTRRLPQDRAGAARLNVMPRHATAAHASSRTSDTAEIIRPILSSDGAARCRRKVWRPAGAVNATSCSGCGRHHRQGRIKPPQRIMEATQDDFGGRVRVDVDLQLVIRRGSDAAGPRLGPADDCRHALERLQAEVGIAALRILGEAGRLKLLEVRRHLLLRGRRHGAVADAARRRDHGRNEGKDGRDQRHMTRQPEADRPGYQAECGYDGKLDSHHEAPRELHLGDER